MYDYRNPYYRNGQRVFFGAPLIGGLLGGLAGGFAGGIVGSSLFGPRPFYGYGPYMPYGPGFGYGYPYY